MPLPGNGTRRIGPADALDARRSRPAGSAPRSPAPWPGSRRPRQPREHAPGWDGLADLHFALAIAAAGLDEAIEEHTGLLHP